MSRTDVDQLGNYTHVNKCPPAKDNLKINFSTPDVQFRTVSTLQQHFIHIFVFEKYN